ncbi:MFS transporter [Bordetella sp. BOR01]|uniref:MFS transporter n=1 Tax=Bordetella sp. BOR01 TaxID=2854779 RepID=UPI001C46692D|nr:MFS transporter [Bordetella sp. BOR01]MBV7482670.1 MFS transporter [Bordetella sp. BOR01]
MAASPLPLAYMPPSAPPLPPAFHRLAWSSLCAQFSEQLALAAAPLVAVLALGAGAAQTGYLQTAQTLPFLLLSLPAGVLADRVSRRGLMAAAEALRTASLLGLLLLLWAHGLSLPWLAALGFAGAIGTVAYNVAAPALVPTLVPGTQLAAANRWLELARSTAFAAGPAVGGALVGAMGASTAYVLAVALSLLAVACLAGLPASPAPPRRALHPLRDLAEGARFVASHALLRPVLVTAVFFNTAWFILQAVYVAYAIDALRLDAAQVGLTLGIYGAGMVAGALAAPRLARRLPFGALIGAGPLAALAAALLMLATLAQPSGLLAGAAFFLFGAGPILWTIATTTLRQAVTPNAMLGRVSAIIVTATFGARPVGAALGALLAARYGTPACLWAMAAGFAVQFGVLFSSPVLRLQQQPGAPAAAPAVS